MPRVLPRRTTRTTLTAASSSLALILALAACGSQLDPAEVAAGQGAVPDVAGTAVGFTPTDIEGDGVVDPAAPEGAAPGMPGTPGADVPGTTGDTPLDTPAGEIPKSAGPDGPSDTPTPAPPGGDVEAASCEGFRNGPGITDSTITIANASDISGPVPGLFEASRQGTQAFIAYFNSTEKLCGRSLSYLPLDSRADAGGDQQAYARACDEAFAVVGSTSSQDSGGAGTAQSCGIPDIRAFSVTPDRQGCSTCFAAYSISSSQISDAIPKFWLQKEPDASQHVAIFYVNVSAASINAESFASAYNKAGMNVDVLQGIDTSEFNFAPYVQQMKDNDIDFVQYFGPYQFAVKLQQAMQQQGFEPSVYLEDPTIYDANYIKQAGSLADGVYVYSPIQLLDDTSIPEMALYRSWLDQVSPGAVPNYYGLFAWSAARLFVEQATKLGGKLDRASLVAALAQVKGWTGNGVHAPMAVGAKTTSPCAKIIQYDGSAWKQVSPGDFMCGKLISTG